MVCHCFTQSYTSDESPQHTLHEHVPVCEQDRKLRISVCSIFRCQYVFFFVFFKWRIMKAVNQLKVDQLTARQDTNLKFNHLPRSAMISHHFRSKENKLNKYIYQEPCGFS